MWKNLLGIGSWYSKSCAAHGCRSTLGPMRKPIQVTCIWVSATFLTNTLMKESQGNLAKKGAGRRCLKMRKQRVGICAQFSLWRKIPSHWVPQKSVLGLILINIIWKDLENGWLNETWDCYLYREILRIVKSQTSGYKAEKDLMISTDWTIKWQMKITVDECEKLQMRQKITLALHVIQWTLN